MATTDTANSENSSSGEASDLSAPLEAALESAISAAVDKAEIAPKEISSGPRMLMVRKLSDIVVLPAGRISQNERCLTADILLQIVGSVEKSLRIEIATRVSRVSECPPALLRMLMLDEPDVAAPILTGAESLPEALVIECAREGLVGHRMMIAKRLDLTSSVADILISFEESDVANILLRREEFTLSPHAVDVLVSRSITDVGLQQMLLRRRELEPVHGFMMFWWVEGERRRRILSRFSLDRRIIQDALEDLYPAVFRSPDADPFVKEILMMTDRRHRPRGLNGEAVSMEVVQKTLEISRRNPAQEVIDAVSMLAGVSRELAARVIRDPSGEAFAVLCKSLGVPRNQFFEFLQSSNKQDNDLTEEAAEELLGVFDSMARDFARAILRYWDWDGNPRIARINGLLGMDEDIL